VNKVLRFSYSSLSSKDVTCEDCKLFKGCYRTTRGYDTRIMCDSFIRKEPYVPKLTDSEWDFHQFLWQVSCSMMNVQTIKNSYMKDWSTPDSLIGLPEERPTFIECCVFNDVMKALYDYLKDNEKILISNDKDMNNIIKIQICVRDNKVICSFTDKYLIDRIKNVIKDTDYKFTNNESVFGTKKEEEIS